MNGNNITYRQQNSFCSKPRCRKCREGIGHGPYWYAYQAVNGRTVRTYIGKTLPPGVQSEQANNGSLSQTSSSATSVQPSFRLFTLGQLRLESSGEGKNWQAVTDASWRSPQVRALLGCFLCSPNRQLTQQQICESLWPELDIKTAAQNVRRASGALGQILGALFLRRSSNILALADQTQLWVDGEAFEELLNRARALPAEMEREHTDLLEQAIKLYRGDFLPDDHAADWSVERRKSLHRQWIGCTLELIDLYLDEQPLSRAVDLLDQLLAVEPANEAAVQRLMFILAYQQRRVEAVQAYQRLATLLNNTYQTMPSPQTQALYASIQQGHKALARPITTIISERVEAEGTESGSGLNSLSQTTDRFSTPEKAVQPQQTNKSTASTRTPPQAYIGRVNQSPLVGRDRELNALHQLITNLESLHGNAPAPEDGGARVLLNELRKTQRTHCVMLVGEAGLGKTRLAEESAREARQRGWTVVWSHAYQQEQGIPYRVWTAALRSILTYTPDLAQQVAEFASSSIYQPLRALVPEMQETLVGAGIKNGSEIALYESLSPEQEELRLREAVFTFLASLSVQTPLMIVLDDMQWTDNSSAQMLGYLARRTSEHPIAILATCRETELGVNRVLNDLIAHMQREQVVEIIHVPPLSDEHIGALVSLVYGLSSSVVTQIQHQAAGNPFFAEELAYSSQTSSYPETPGKETNQEGRQTLPGTIAAALTQRLNRLSSDCRALLDKAAVLGGSFDFDLIAAMESRGTTDDDVVLDLLDEALHLGVLTEEGSGAHVTYHFWHPLLASHLYHELSATRRGRLHRRIAQVLQQVYQSRKGEAAATITQHLVRGGEEPAKIAQYAEIAADHAYSLFAYAETERYYRLALKYLAPVLLELPYEADFKPDMPQEQRLHLGFLVERLAECTRSQGNFHDATIFYKRAIQLYTSPSSISATPEVQRQEAQTQAVLWSEIAWIWRYTASAAAARECTARAEEVLYKAGITDGPAWGSLRHQQAGLYWYEGYHQEALKAALKALSLFTANLAEQTEEPRSQIRTSPASRQTRTALTLQGDSADIGRVHAFLGILYAALGQLSEALKHLQEALTIYEQHDRRREHAHGCCNIGHIYLLKAEYDKAQSYFQRALNYIEQSGDTPLKSVILYNRGELASIAHDFTSAEQFYREGLTLVEQINDREYLSTWHAILGNLLREQGRFKEAASAILHALSLGRSMPNQPCIGFALVALANLRLTMVENTQIVKTPQGQRAIRHAEVDLHRALNLRGPDVETRTRAQLTQAYASRLRGNLALARKQGLQACSDAQKYELYGLYERGQKWLDSLPSAQ